MSYQLSRDDAERVAKGLTAYRKELIQRLVEEVYDPSEADYYRVEISEIDELAARMSLDVDYYEPEHRF